MQVRGSLRSNKMIEIMKNEIIKMMQDIVSQHPLTPEQVSLVLELKTMETKESTPDSTPECLEILCGVRVPSYAAEAYSLLDILDCGEASDDDRLDADIKELERLGYISE
jgi:hypothetical protein